MLENNKQQSITPPNKIQKSKLINVEWKEFCISDIFTIESGKRLTKADMIEGNKPFIGATDSNNGITAWVSNSNESNDKNVLGVNYNGSVVETFYHPYECIFSDDVKRLHLKANVKDVGYVMLFMKSIILKQKEKYAYGYKFNEKRMQRQVILLPVTSTGEPDYAFMSSFMRDIEEDILKATLKYFDDGTERNGTERNGTERNGTERNGTERNGTER